MKPRVPTAGRLPGASLGILALVCVAALAAPQATLATPQEYELSLPDGGGGRAEEQAEFSRSPRDGDAAEQSREAPGPALPPTEPGPVVTATDVSTGRGESESKQPQPEAGPAFPRGETFALAPIRDAREPLVVAASGGSGVSATLIVIAALAAVLGAIGVWRLRRASARTSGG